MMFQPETVTVQHVRTGREVTWNARTRYFTGDEDLVNWSDVTMVVERKVYLGQPGQESAFPINGTPNGAAAAMLHVCCGDGMVVVPNGDGEPARFTIPPF